MAAVFSQYLIWPLVYTTGIPISFVAEAIPALGLLLVSLLFRIASGIIPPVEDWKNLELISLLGATLSRVYGYIFMELSMAGYKLFDFLTLFKGESEISEGI
jgi:hypothetical protein